MATRLWVLRSPLGGLNADEAYTGLQSADILAGRLPIVIQGSTYSAVLESYLFAPVVAIFGQHVVALKMISVVAWASASVLLSLAARRVVRSSWAALAGALMWLAPGAMTIVSTRAYVGYASGMALVTGALWALQRATSEERPDPARSAVAGAVCGAAFYVHPMFMAVVLPMLAVACVARRRDVRSWWAPCAAGFVAANGPFLLWNVVNGWPSLDQPVESTESPIARMSRFFTGLLPRVFGLRAQEGAWVIARPVAMVIYAALLTVIVVGATRLARRGVSGLLVTVPLVLCWPTMALLANLSFVRDARYAVIALPFLLLSIVACLEGTAERVVSRWRGFVQAVVVVTWVGALSLPLLRHDLGLDLGDPNAATAELIDVLEERGVNRVAGYYWLVLPIEYQSDRQIRSAVAGFPFLVRVPTSQRLVEQSPPETVGFVFDPTSDNPALLRMPVDSYERIKIAGAILYVPRAMPAIATETD